jgi:GNAT superfamily N-acetyltransferase
MSVAIEYRVDRALSADEFIDILTRSTLGERRPVADRACMEGMVAHAGLMVTAWDGRTLIGVARSVTDFCYACYLSDLAVDVRYQRTGIGRTLVQQTLKQLGPRCKIRLLAAPAAADYYRKIGFVQNMRCWELGHAPQQLES